MPSEHADVLIIGAGPAGGVAARRFAEAGLSVVALEQGHWQDRHNYRGSEWDWELAASKQYSPLPFLRGSPLDYPIDTSESDMLQINFCGVGGSTILFNAIWMRLLESNFRTRSVTGLGDDWPITYEELLPFYERADRQVGCSGLGGNPAWPPGAEPPLPPLPLGEGGLIVARALAKRGWHWWPDTNAILSAPYDGRYACVQRGACPSGCNEGAKSSADLTHWRRVAEAGGRIITGARVRQIHTDDNGLVTGAEWLDEDGVAHFQSADVVFCCANGIGTPRLLLNSASAPYPDGLANSSGLVGKRLMLHPLSSVRAEFPQQLEAWQGSNGSWLQVMQFAEDDASRGYRLGAKWGLHPTAAGPIAEAMAVFAEGGSPADHHRRLRERLGHSVHFSIMCEDLPLESNQVVLSDTMTDSSGMPAPKILYRYDENSLRNLDYNVARAVEIFEDAGALKVEARNPAGANAHFMGTARMGDDPRGSVVDRWCMSHDAPNFGILDGSVFVTSASANPTSTITALSLRAAEHLLDNRASVPTPARRTQVALGPNAAPRKLQAAEPALPTAAQRARLADYAGALIPDEDGMPSARRVGDRPALLDRVLGSRPDLAEPLGAALDAPCETPEAGLANLAATAPMILMALQTVIAACYYTDPEVKQAIGYGGQVAKPFTPERFPAFMAEGLLDHLLTEEA